jgi:ribosomal protein S18 acetylase RimI-like enzyme
MEFKSLFEVRLATYDDIPDILNITREAFTKYQQMANTPHLEALEETYSDVKRDIDTKVVLIALSDNTPVGSVRVEIFEDHTAYLSRFGVKVTSQNNGIGKSIMNLVDRIMIRKGVKSIYLHTGSKVTPLIRFYYGRGFYIESTDNSRGYIRAKLQKDYITY